MERCGAYAEHWEYLGKPKGWKGCSLPKGHKGFHRDDEESSKFRVEKKGLEGNNE